LLSNLQHFKRAPAKPTTLPNCQFPTNELNSGAPMRALLSALEQWVTSDIAPPASRYPSRLDKTLVSPNQIDVGFPAIPGVSYPKVLFLPQTNQDPQSDGQALIGKAAFYPVFLPRTDRDGRDIAGLRVPSVEVPLATYMGWNLQNDRYNAGHLCGLTGSTIALPKDKAARLASGDPRLSIEERYSSSYSGQAQLGRAADKLIRERLLLAEDKSLFVH
jgi:hypothetical protein